MNRCLICFKRIEQTLNDNRVCNTCLSKFNCIDKKLYYDGVEIPMDIHSEEFHLVTRIQDEAHRFAIEYHRSLRKKEQVHSVLDDIPGIGPKRRKALMKAFENIGDIKEATVEQLSAIPEIPLNIAEEIYSFFHSSVIR